MIDPDGDEASAKLAIARPGPGSGCVPSDLISRAAAVALVIEACNECDSGCGSCFATAAALRALPAAPAYADMPPSVRYVLTAITECYAHPIDTPERTEAWKRVCDLVAALAVDPVEAEYVAAAVALADHLGARPEAIRSPSPPAWREWLDTQHTLIDRLDKARAARDKAREQVKP